MVLARSDGSKAAMALASRDFVRAASIDLFRIRAGASDAAEAGRRLSAALDRLMAEIATLMVVNDEAIPRSPLYNLETMEPDAAPAPADHWAFAVAEMKMTPEQEREMTELLRLFRAAVESTVARRQRLLERQQALGAAADGGLLEEVERSQLEFTWRAMAFAFAAYGELLAPTQFASACVAAFPMTLSLLGVAQGLEALVASRAAEATAPDAAAPE